MTLPLPFFSGRRQGWSGFLDELSKAVSLSTNHSGVGALSISRVSVSPSNQEPLCTFYNVMQLWILPREYSLQQSTTNRCDLEGVCVCV